MTDHQIWTTADYPAGQRLTYWAEVHCEVFLELKVDSPVGQSFSGTVATEPLGPLGVNLIRSDEQRLVRTRQAISRGQLKQLYLVHARGAPSVIRQLGREVVLEQGRCTLFDSRFPFTIESAKNHETLSVAIPPEWLLTWVPDPEEAVARTWKPGEGWGGVLSAALANLNPGSLAALPVPGSVMSDQIGSLLALAADEAVPRGAGPRARPLLLGRLRDSLRAGFHDPALTPLQVARYHGISLRYLHLQFALGGTSFGAELAALRLEAARRLLLDRRFDGLSVTEIAMRCGFSNASHFARRFRDRFGHAPVAFREGAR